MPRHLGCRACRIRVRASAPGVALLEGRCPICAAPLSPVSAAEEVVGFRLFDLDPFSEKESHGKRSSHLNPPDLFPPPTGAVTQPIGYGSWPR